MYELENYEGDEETASSSANVKGEIEDDEKVIRESEESDSNARRKRDRSSAKSSEPPSPDNKRKKEEDSIWFDPDIDDEDEEEEEEVHDEEDEAKNKDDEWTEEAEQGRSKRVRKKPVLFINEISMTPRKRGRPRLPDSKKRVPPQKKYDKRGRPPLNSSTPRESNHSTPKINTNATMASVMRPMPPSPMRYTDTELKLAVARGLYEIAFARMIPNPLAPLPHPDQRKYANYLMKQPPFNVKLSGGFKRFLQSLTDESIVCMYELVTAVFNAPQDGDIPKIAASLRQVWNSFMFATRRQWERAARKLVREHDSPNLIDLGDEEEAEQAASQQQEWTTDTAKRMPEQEVQVVVDEEIMAKEEEYDTLRATSHRGIVLEEDDFLCPLCLGAAREVPLKSISQVKGHFMDEHWQVHGYACHYCGEMYRTPDELVDKHSKKCDRFTSWFGHKILNESASCDVTSKLSMTHASMIMACADCGMHLGLPNVIGPTKHNELRVQMLKKLLQFHNNAGLLPIIIYYPAKPDTTLKSINFSMVPMCMGAPLLSCEHCPSVSFDSALVAEKHYAAEHTDHARTCPECHVVAGTELYYRHHAMEHVTEFTALADYLSHSAHVFPPPWDRWSAPRLGWLQRQKQPEITGLQMGSGDDDLVDPDEDCVQEKLQNCRRRRMEEEKGERQWVDAEMPDNAGFENTIVPMETPMARHVRNRLFQKYEDCTGIRNLDDSVLFSQEAAEKFQEWMDYWESDEGKAAGGPPRGDYKVQVPPIDVPERKVCILLNEISDVLLGYRLTEHVYYCFACDTLLQGALAAAHLQEDGSSTCAVQADGAVERTPAKNENMRVVFVASMMDKASRLNCPHCETFKSCSISGLRYHCLNDHGIFVRCTQKAESEDYLRTSPRREIDMRSDLAKRIDADFGMPNGRLERMAQPLPLSDRYVLEKLIGPGYCSQDAPVLQQQPKQHPRLMDRSMERYPITQNVRATPLLPVRQANAGRQPMSVKDAVGKAFSTPAPRIGPGARTSVSTSPHLGAMCTTARIILPIEIRGTKYLNCRLCGPSANYWDLEMIKEHILRMHLYACGHCSNFFSNPAFFSQHLRVCRANQTSFLPDPRSPYALVRCPHCELKMQMRMYAPHLVDVHANLIDVDGVTKKIVPMCKIVVTANRRIPVHRFKYYMPESKEHRCSICHLRCGSTDTLRLHVATHPENTRFCGYCARESAEKTGNIISMTRHYFKKHIMPEKQAGVITYCSSCHEDCSGRALLHALYECRARHQCTLCPDLPVYDSSEELLRHRDECHNDVYKRFQCSRCSAHFYNFTDFVRHQCSLDNSKFKIRCECGKVVAAMVDFAFHLHMKHVTNQACNFCGYINDDDDDASIERHRKSHMKLIQEPRHLLLCFYGDLSRDQHQLSLRLSTPSTATRPVLITEDGEEVGGGMSDDDDVQCLEVAPPTLLQQLLTTTVNADCASTIGEEGGREGSSTTPQPPITPYREEDLPDDADDEATVEWTVKRLCSTVVQIVAPEEADAETRAFDNATAAAASAPQSWCGADIDEPQGINDHAEFDSNAGDDDDLCVVAEIEKPCSSATAAALNNQREKKFACDQCSCRFMTAASLAVHADQYHPYEGAATAVTEEFGIPVDRPLYICRCCCLAFPDIDSHSAHIKQHRNYAILACDSCSGVAYNNEILNQHLAKLRDNRITYVCHACKVEFFNEQNLFEHLQLDHRQTLFTFCKACSIGSTDGLRMYHHYKEECTQANAGMYHRGQDRPLGLLGQCMAQQLHYQPNDVEAHKLSVAEGTIRVVKPALCNHRTLLVATGKMVTCPECYCLKNMQSFLAELTCANSGGPIDFKTTLAQESAPFKNLIMAYQFSRLNPARRSLNLQPSSTMPSMSQSAAISRGRGQIAGMPFGAVVVSRGGSTTMANAIGGRGGSTYPPPQSPPIHRPVVVRGSRGRYPTNGNLVKVVRALEMPTRSSASSPASPSGLPEWRVTNGASTSSSSSMRLPVVLQRRAETPQRLTRDSPVAERSSVDRTTRAPSTLIKQCETCQLSLMDDRDHALHAMHCQETDKMYICSQCPIGFVTQQNAVVHMIRNHHYEDQTLKMELMCPVDECGVISTTPLALNSHLRSSHANLLPHQAEQCSLHFASEESRSAHDAKHEQKFAETGLEQQCCKLCGTLDQWSIRLKDKNGVVSTYSHSMYHAMDKRTLCRICLKTFPDDGDHAVSTHYILSHTSRSRDDETFGQVCDACPGRILFKDDDEMRRHCVAVHKITELRPQAGGRLVAEMSVLLKQTIGL